MEMTPKQVYLVEWHRDTWDATILNPKGLSIEELCGIFPLNRYFQDTPKNIYKLDIDWRLLKDES